MDIGTGKDLPANPKFEILSSKQILNSKFEIRNYNIGYYLIKGVKVWLYDVVKPDYRFSVADYVKCANVVIKDIWKRGKLPILVGGTGFYLKAVVDGIETMGVEPDGELRRQLDSWTAGQIGSLLKELDRERWERMNESDRRNPRRLVRAIEVAVWKLEVGDEKLDEDVGSGKKRKSHFSFQNLASNLQYPTSTLFIGLTAPYEILYERIDKRVDERVKQGIIKEIEGLLKEGYDWENSALGKTIGYQEWGNHFVGSQFTVHSSQLRKEIIQRWKYNEHGYARRQMIWFRKDKRIHWFDITQKSWHNKVERLVRGWYNPDIICHKR